MTVIEPATLSERTLARWPRTVRFILLAAAWTIAICAALAPIVYLLRRIGVG